MKKLLALLLVTCMVFAFAGCTANTAESTTTLEEDLTALEEVLDEVIEEVEAEEAAPAEDVAEEVAEEVAITTVKEGVLTMATNAAFPPYEYVEGGTIVGIDAEIVEAIAGKLGLGFEIQDMEFDSVIPAVTMGKADMGLAGITVTEERAEQVDFTASYATGVQVVIVTEDSAITSVDDLFADDAAYKIGVQRNTTGDLYTTWDLEDAGLATIDRYSRGADAVQALITGKVDCVVIDNQPAMAFVAENEGLMILESEYALEDYAAAMNKDNAALSAAVGAAMEELIADGTIQAIIDKYITAE